MSTESHIYMAKRNPPTFHILMIDKQTNKRTKKQSSRQTDRDELTNKQANTPEKRMSKSYWGSCGLNTMTSWIVISGKNNTQYAETCRNINLLSWRKLCFPWTSSFNHNFSLSENDYYVIATLFQVGLEKS